jgi:hypothetical protein
MAVDPILPPDDPTPDPAPAPAPRARRGTLIECEFCGCRLTPEGEVMVRGELARRHLDLEDALRKSIASLESKEAELSEALAELRALKEPKKRSIF